MLRTDQLLLCMTECLGGNCCDDFYEVNDAEWVFSDAVCEYL